MTQVNARTQPSIRATALLYAAIAAADCSTQTASVLNVRDFGAKGDGIAKDTIAIQSSLDAAAKQGGGTVHIPAGRYLSGTIHLKNNVTLQVSHGAVLAF